jgi:hypothetical protein
MTSHARLTSGGRPYISDRRTEWALSSAMRGHRRWRTNVHVRAYDTTVTRASPNRPYGRSIHGRGYLTHLPRDVYLAWRGGRLVGARTRWCCGGATALFVLLDEPNSPLCPLCLVAVNRTATATHGRNPR